VSEISRDFESVSVRRREARAFAASSHRALFTDARAGLARVNEGVQAHGGGA
jgi:hypothetical protein